MSEHAVRWLDRHRDGAAPADVLAFADRLPPVDPEQLTGRWQGAELPTGHPFDGLLTAHGWWGKEVRDPETVHPLLVRDRTGRPRPVDPRCVPLGPLRRWPRLAASPVARAGGVLARPLLRTSRPGARVRVVVHRGVPTAALVYDRLPVVDALRAVAPGVLLGLMDMRGVPRPFPFVLRR